MKNIDEEKSGSEKVDSYLNSLQTSVIVLAIEVIILLIVLLV